MEELQDALEDADAAREGEQRAQARVQVTWHGTRELAHELSARLRVFSPTCATPHTASKQLLSRHTHPARGCRVCAGVAGP